MSTSVQDVPVDLDWLKKQAEAKIKELGNATQWVLDKKSTQPPVGSNPDFPLVEAAEGGGGPPYEAQDVVSIYGADPSVSPQTGCIFEINSDDMAAGDVKITLPTEILGGSYEKTPIWIEFKNSIVIKGPDGCKDHGVWTFAVSYFVPDKSFGVWLKWYPDNQSPVPYFIQFKWGFIWKFESQESEQSITWQRYQGMVWSGYLVRGQGQAESNEKLEWQLCQVG